MEAVISKTKPISERMALSVMNRYTPDEVEWHYEHGLALQSIFLLGETTGCDEYCRWANSMYDTKVKEDGSIFSYQEDEYNLDQINPGKGLFLLYNKYGEEKYRKALELLISQIRRQPRTKAGGFWHKNIYPWQMWLDGLYMAAPFYAEYTAKYGNPGDFDDVVRQFVLMESKARNGETGLLYHAWDESRKQLWANPDSGCSPHFWGRDLGWYCMALTDTLDYIPQDNVKHQDDLKAIARRLIVPLLKYQDKKSGLWYQVLDRGSCKKNYTESSASAMFIYFLLKSIRIGVVPKIDIPQVRDAALAAYEGFLREKVREDEGGLHLTGICKVAGLGGDPYRDGSYEYYVNEPVSTDDFKGVGPFILASMAIEDLKNNSQ
jgi:unsaturated rhamnogalacturonyl hydrolase